MGKQLANSLASAKSEASEMSLNGTLNIANDHVKFMVKHGLKTYKVDICHTPSCSCPDRRPCHCKHILWVFLYVLNVQEDDKCLKDKMQTRETLLVTLGNAGKTQASRCSEQTAISEVPQPNFQLQQQQQQKMQQQQ